MPSTEFMQVAKIHWVGERARERQGIKGSEGG